MRRHLPSVLAIRDPSELPKTSDTANVLHLSAYERTPFEEVMKKPSNTLSRLYKQRKKKRKEKEKKKEKPWTEKSRNEIIDLTRW